MSDVLKYTPAVFVVGSTYQIMVAVNCETVMWAQVGDKCYYDESNGILRSATTVHRMTVPAKELDVAGKYKICYRKMINRKVYNTETSEIYGEEFDFYPVKGKRISAYHISDSHSMVDAPVASAKLYEKEYGCPDFLVLNGDVINHSGSLENFDKIYDIVGQITGGNLPVVFSRGNHDTRGFYAERMADFTPVENGNSYFTFRLGSLWGVVLDSGEDKWDWHEEYGNTACFHEFRERQITFLKEIIAHAEQEYLADGVTYRVVVAHNPFTRKYTPYPFNVDEDIFAEWASLLKEHVKPQVMICGHVHFYSVDWPGGEEDGLGQPCPVVIGTQPESRDNYCAGAGLIFNKDRIDVIFNDHEKVLEQQVITAERM